MKVSTGIPNTFGTSRRQRKAVINNHNEIAKFNDRTGIGSYDDNKN